MRIPYAFGLLLVALLITGAVGAFNYLVDPYALFRFGEVDSDRLSRIDQFNHMRVTKPWYLQQVKPSAVVVGSSRSARLHPEHAAWDGDTGYNMAVPGMTISEINQFVRHAHAVRPLSKVMIGLDYEAFIRPVPVTRPGFEPARMARSSEDLHALKMKKQRATDWLDSLFSVPALSLSIAAASGTSKPGRYYFKNGTWETTTNFLTGRAGYVYVGQNVVKAHRSYDFDIENNLVFFEEVLRFCHENAIETRLFFTPTHVLFVDLWRRLGDKGMWMGFHRRVAALNEQVALEYGAEPFPLWGFSHAEGIVNEPIYKGKSAARAWYDDGVHTRVKLGRKMMNDVWGSKTRIGQKVSAGNVDRYLAEVIGVMDEFLLANADQVAELYAEMGLE